MYFGEKSVKGIM